MRRELQKAQADEQEKEATNAAVHPNAAAAGSEDEDSDLEAASDDGRTSRPARPGQRSLDADFSVSLAASAARRADYPKDLDMLASRLNEPRLPLVVRRYLHQLDVDDPDPPLEACPRFK